MMMAMMLLIFVSTELKAMTGNCKYEYDSEHRLVKKELMRWSEQKSDWEAYLCWSFTYDENGLTIVELKGWDEQKKAFCTPVKRMVYHPQTGYQKSVEVYVWNPKTKEYVLEKEMNVNHSL